MLLFVGTAAPLGAQQGEEKAKPSVRADLQVFFEAKHRASEDYWAFDYPIYGNIGVLYEGDGLEAAVSVDLIEKVFIGDTYVLGGRDYSFLKLGNFTETWRTGYSWSVIDILNKRDDRYPNNVFWRNILRPNPMFAVSVGGRGWAQQILASQKEGSEKIDDQLLGARSLILQSVFETGIGIIRHAGYPPPLLFLTAKNESERTSAWLELGWWIYQDSPDTVNGVIGARQDFRSAYVVAEFIVEYSNLILFLEQKSGVTRRIAFDIQSYLYLNDFSAALKSYITTAVEEHTDLEFGTLLFFGEEGSYFTRFDPLTDNDNQIYIKLDFSI
jgi:hypothetical protein